MSHVRTKNTDHEIDLIVECPDRRVIAVEVKLARAVSDADVRHLNWLQSQIGDQVIERVVINTGSHAYRRSDGQVIPLGLPAPERQGSPRRAGVRRLGHTGALEVRQRVFAEVAFV